MHAVVIKWSDKWYQTELVLFMKKHTIPQINRPKLNSIQLGFSDHVLFLGLVLDRKQNWKMNAQELVKKAAAAQER